MINTTIRKPEEDSYAKFNLLEQVSDRTTHPTKDPALVRKGSNLNSCTCTEIGKLHSKGKPSTRSSCQHQGKPVHRMSISRARSSAVCLLSTIVPTGRAETYTCSVTAAVDLKARESRSSRSLERCTYRCGIVE